VETSQLRSELLALWRELAVNPRNRALAVAYILKHRDEPATRQLFVELITRQTPPSQERDEALRLLTPSTLFSHIQMVDKPKTTSLRVDAELGRLAIAQSWAAEFRLWIVGRDITRNNGGSGVVSKTALKDRLRALGVSYVPRHYNRLLAQGSGVFWHLNGSQIYLRSIVNVARDLVEASPTLDNLPGVREVYVDVSGSLEQWEAMLYAGWMAYRGYTRDVTIARETLAQLFHRHENTFLRWEETHLSLIISKRTNYAQCPDVEHYFPYLPDHAQAYVAKTYYKNRVREEIRLRWQLPNSYHAAITYHERRGQAANVRKALNAKYPAYTKRGGHCLRYLPSFEKLKRLYRSIKFRKGLLGDVRKPVYVYRGEHRRTKHGIFEITNTGFLFTHPNERAAPKREQEVLSKRGSS